MSAYKTKIVLGFSGSREGMTGLQKIGVRYWLDFFQPRFVVHGMCVGADEIFDLICEGKKIVRRGRPGKPVGHALRSECRPQQILPVMPPLARNEVIVRDSDVVLCCPKMNARCGGGTWYTHDAAITAGRRVIDMYPDGSCDLNFSPFNGDLEPVRYEMSETRKGFVLSEWEGNRDREAPHA